MQNSPTATATHPSHLAQPWASPTHMYPNSSAHQRNSANPRAAYDTAGGAQTDDYSSYQQATAGFSGVGGVGGYNYGSGMSLYNANTTSPSLPSGSRRTSGPKQASSPATATAQSPYQQPASASTIGHHGQGGVNPSQAQYGGYGGGYPYDSQYQHHQGGQWAQHYGQQSNFAQQPAGGQQRQTSSGSMSTVGAGNVNEPAQTASRSGGGASFDYASAQQQAQQASYQNWDSQRAAQWQQHQQAGQQAGQQPRAPGSSGGQPPAPGGVSPWQNYGSHQPFPPPPQPVPHMGGQLPPGQYPQWNQWQQGYYPPAPHPGVQQPPPAAGAPPAAAGGKKKSKKEQAAAAAAAAAEADASLLGKRAAESAPEEEKHEKTKSKKSKKEEEKPAPKPPAKSHLKPPRQAPSAWQLFFTDELNKAKASAAAEAGTTPGGTPIHPKLNVAQIAKDAGAAYAALDEERKAHYAQKVEEGKVQYQKDLAVWQATLTPDDIKAENAFRAQQRKEGKSRKGNLKDPNAPKKPLSAYFLFLKGIRENDELRKQVWGEETETTRQSVLAAERWRGLSDEEKRPYLQQAEKDKQEYENLRKIYEDDAAARARGETVPDRPQFAEVQSSVVEPPKSLLEPKKEDQAKESASSKPAAGEADASAPAVSAASSESVIPPVVAAATPTTATTVDPASTTFTVVHESTPDPDTTNATAPAPAFDAALEIDEFHGFDDMDLTGLEGMTGHGESTEAQWDDLQYVEGGGGEASGPVTTTAATEADTEATSDALATDTPAEPAADVEAAIPVEPLPEVTVPAELKEEAAAVAEATESAPTEPVAEANAVSEGAAESETKPEDEAAEPEVLEKEQETLAAGEEMAVDA